MCGVDNYYRHAYVLLGDFDTGLLLFPTGHVDKPTISDGMFQHL